MNTFIPRAPDHMQYSQETFPTGHFTISEPQDLEVHELYVVLKRQSADFEALNLWKGRSGKNTLPAFTVSAEQSQLLLFIAQAFLYSWISSSLAGIKLFRKKGSKIRNTWRHAQKKEVVKGIAVFLSFGLLLLHTICNPPARSYCVWHIRINFQFQKSGSSKLKSELRKARLTWKLLLKPQLVIWALFTCHRKYLKPDWTFHN